MKPGDNVKMIASGILGDMRYGIEIQVISDEWKNCGEFIVEIASENSRWVDAAAWNSKVTKSELSNLCMTNENMAAKYGKWMPAECGK